MNKQQPKVSICVPVYNVEQYISRCLDSLINQTYDNIEIIVIDDCSPDHSITIAAEYALIDDRIRILKHPVNKGLMRSRQTGYLNATGDFITFCDSDDELPLNAIEVLCKVAENTNADIISGDIDYIDINNKTTRWSYHLAYGNDAYAVYHALLNEQYGHNLCSKLFKSSILKSFQYITYDNFTNGEDGCLFYQIVQHSECTVHTNDVVYRYYQNMASSSNKRMEENGLRSVCLVNKARVEILGDISEFDVELSRFISKVLADLYYGGYNRNGSLDAIIRENDLEKFSSIYCYIKYFSLQESLKLLLKRFIIRKK